MGEFWRSGTFCDVTIIVDKREFSAHRMVLATASPFMSGMLTSPMSEAQTGKVTLCDMPADVFAICLEWMYFGKCSTPKANLMQLLDASALLQLGGLLSATANAIGERLDDTNCLDAWEYAERYALDTLRDACKEKAVTSFATLPLADKTLEAERS